MNPIKIVQLVCFILLATGTAHAAEYYVGKTGSDGNSCAQTLNPSTPKLTIAAGMACLSSGDTLTVRAGTYVESELGNQMPNGTAGNYTTIRANTGDTVIVGRGSVPEQLPACG